MKSADLIALLQEFYGDKQALCDRHVEGAKHVSAYESNNTYQYVVNRETAHLSWIRQALESAGAAVPAPGTGLPVPEGKGDAHQRAIVEDDARRMREYHAKWAPRLDGITHARHRNLLRLVLGETVEQIRFFDQMLEGREDVLGRRAVGASTGGGVLPTRWVE